MVHGSCLKEGNTLIVSINLIIRTKKMLIRIIRHETDEICGVHKK